MLLEKVKDTRKEIWIALNDLCIDDVAVFKSGNETIITSFVMVQGEAHFMVLSDVVHDIYRFDDLVEYLEKEEFGFAYYKRYRDLDIYY